MCKIKSFFAIFFLSLCFFSKAQKLKFDSYTSKDGLISDDIYKVFQDQRGYIWLFTDYGAMKYNGKTFEPVLKNLSFNESFIYSYYQNSKGQIWVANSNAKIYEVKNDSAFIVKGTENISEDLKKTVSEITQLYVDDSLNIYAVTKLFTYKFLKNRNYKGINLNSQFKSNSIAYKVLCKGDYLLPIFSETLSQRKDAYFLKERSIKIILQNCNSSCDTVVLPSLVLTGPKYFKRYGDDFYIIYYNKIVRIKKDYSIKEIQLNSIVNSFVRDNDGHLWVGCYNNGLFEIDHNDSIINHYLIDKTVNDVFIDSHKSIWASTSGFGLFHCKGSSTFYFDKTDPLGLPIKLMKKIDGKIFVFNNQGDLFIVEENKVSNVNKTNDIKSEPLDVIKYHSLFYLSYRHKTEYFDLKKGVVKTILPFQKAFFASYRYNRMNEDTLLLVNRHGIMVVCNDSILDSKEFTFKVFDCCYRNRKILIATDEGIYEYSNNKLSRPSYLEGTEKCILSKIVKGKLGDIWFCSKGYGLFKLNSDNRLTHFTIENGLPSNVINDISFKTDHSILISTNIGLFHSSKYKKWVEIYPEQVYSAVEFKRDIYFSTKDGLIISKDVNPNEQNLIYFNLASILIAGKATSEKNIQKLKYNQNNIEFNFDIIAPSSSISDIIYQLNGRKNNIGITKNQQIVFQNLPPGSYTLTASLVANNIKSTPVTIYFNISPAFWQTIWFIVLSVLVALAICLLIILKLFKYVKNKESRKNEADKLIAEYKLIALKSQINPHFMSNCLTAIQHLIISNKIDEANQYLAKFSFLVRQVLNFSSKNMVTLKEELDLSELNIELEQLRFENKFSFEIKIDKPIDLKNIMVPPLILQPIIENAIWHGLLPLKKLRSGILKIFISIEDKILKIIVEDNGLGRKNAQEFIGNLKDSKGIKIVEQRIQSLNNLHNTDIGNIVFEDKFDKFNASCGVRVVICLPLFS